MKKSSIKKLLKTAYTFNESDSEKQFIRSYEQKSMQLWTVVKTEFRFMGLKSAAFGIVLFIILFVITLGDAKNAMWCVSSILPLFAMLLAIMMGSSERYEMDELESACRFSLSFVRMVRMLIIGACSLSLILLCTFIVHKSAGGQFINTLCCVAFPYLVNVFGCICVTRKIHRKDGIFACAGVTCISCLLPLIFRVKIMNMIKPMGSLGASTVLILILALTVRESIIYIQEGDKKIWNLC